MVTFSWVLCGAERSPSGRRPLESKRRLQGVLEGAVQSQFSALLTPGMSPPGAGEFWGPGGHRDHCTFLGPSREPGSQESNERWNRGGDKQTKPPPGHGVGDKGRRQVTEVSKGEDFDTGRRAQGWPKLAGGGPGRKAGCSTRESTDFAT